MKVHAEKHAPSSDSDRSKLRLTPGERQIGEANAICLASTVVRIWYFFVVSNGWRGIRKRIASSAALASHRHSSRPRHRLVGVHAGPPRSPPRLDLGQETRAGRRPWEVRPRWRSRASPAPPSPSHAAEQSRPRAASGLAGLELAGRREGRGWPNPAEAEARRPRARRSRARRRTLLRLLPAPSPPPLPALARRSAPAPPSQAATARIPASGHRPASVLL